MAIRLKAISLTESLNQQDFIGELGSINAFVRDEIRYLRDIYGAETLQWPEATLIVGAGDCDDKAMLMAALAMAAGFECRYVALWRDGAFMHVWTEAKVAGKFIACETTAPVPCGQTGKLKPGDGFLDWPIIPDDHGAR